MLRDFNNSNNIIRINSTQCKSILLEKTEKIYTLFLSYRESWFGSWVVRRNAFSRGECVIVLILSRWLSSRLVIPCKCNARGCEITISRPSGDLIEVNTLALILRIHGFVHKSAPVAYFPIRCRHMPAR